MEPITIIGNGALGLLFASFFAAKKIKVQIITKKELSASEINKYGIFITDLSGKVINYKDNLYATTDYNRLQPSDISIILTKAYSTQEAVEKNLKFLKATKTIITLQNGLGNVEILDRYLSENNIIAGTTSLGATAIDFNKTKYCGKGIVDIASFKNIKSDESVLRELSELFEKSDIICNIHKNWKTVVWSKLYVNAIINPITALYKVKNGGILENPELTKLAKQISDEILNILKAEQIEIQLEHPFERILKICKITSSNHSSMLQDILNHKQTEIEQITGEIIRIANKSGIETPINRMMYEKLKLFR
jgi:2-dehydropantoate 2-reductase